MFGKKKYGNITAEIDYLALEITGFKQLKKDFAASLPGASQTLLQEVIEVIDKQIRRKQLELAKRICQLQQLRKADKILESDGKLGDIIDGLAETIADAQNIGKKIDEKIGE
jgi:hypothetical protein